MVRVTQADLLVLDAAVVIAVLDETDVHHRSAVRLLAENTSATLLMSALTYAEVLVGPARHGRLDLAVRLLDDLGVATVGLADTAGAELADIRARTGSKMPDCCVLLAAREHGGQVATFEERLRVSAAALGLRCV